MAFFGSSWFEDDKPIGPFAHWLEDEDNEFDENNLYDEDEDNEFDENDIFDDDKIFDWVDDKRK